MNCHSQVVWEFLCVFNRELAEELLPFLKEAIDKKQDNLRRRRKRDVLRVQLAHIFQLLAENRVFAQR